MSELLVNCIRWLNSEQLQYMAQKKVRDMSAFTGHIAIL